MQLPGQTKWTPGVCTGQHGPRSYNVRVDDREFRRNRRQLLYTKEARPLEPPNIDPNVETPTASDGTVGPAEQMPDTRMPLELGSSPASTTSSPVEQEPSTPQPLRRSGRTRRPPDWITNYVPS